MPVSTDTVAAISSALGGAIAVIRMTGPDSDVIAGRVWKGKTAWDRLPLREMHKGVILDADQAVVDQVVGVRYAAESSYTGEPMAELFTHGGRMAAQSVLKRLLAAGARPAAPGDFTRRAFLNGKLDLTQTEAVADVIAAQSEHSLRVAQRHLAGVFGRRLHAVERDLQELLSEMEARLDFPEENLVYADSATLARTGADVIRQLEEMLKSRHAGEVLRHGFRVVIAGPPNAGKSSLLNALLGRDRAIVTPIPGTTRDVLEESFQFRGWPVCLVDTAGLRETADVVETDGIRRAQDALAAADTVIWLLDAAVPPAQRPEPPAELAGVPLLRVLNKTDLAALPSSSAPPGPEVISISAKTGAGLELLLDRLEERLGTRTEREPEIAVNERQARLLETALHHAREAVGQMAGQAWELAAVNWRGALQATGEITGKTHTPDILDTIFSRFCIGK